MKYEVIVYFDGPLSKWKQSYDHSEVVARKQFRFQWMALGWARARTKGMDRLKIAIEYK